MKNCLNKLFQLSFFLVFLILPCTAAFAENNFGSSGGYGDDSESGCVIDYYGVISNDLDTNMSTMISDLYYTQLSEIPNFTIFDKRVTPLNTRPSNPDIRDAENNIFYTEIVKNKSEETWTLTYIILDKISKQPVFKEKKYDSFYKILMESKNELEVSVKDMITEGKMRLAGDSPNAVSFFSDDSDYIFDDNNGTSNNGSVTGADRAGSGGTAETAGNTGAGNMGAITSSKERIEITSVEMLSGTWKGDSSIDKIVILRGGRGFIIFKNGASMNITITLDENDSGQVINVKQKGNSNASFYPELPRQIALIAAVSAPPMEWSMILLENMVMEGTKTTLVQDNESFKVSKVPVSWQKVN